MTKAKVNGVECVIYGFLNINDVKYCRVWFYVLGNKTITNVPAEMVEVEYEV